MASQADFDVLTGDIEHQSAISTIDMNVVEDII